LPKENIRTEITNTAKSSNFFYSSFLLSKEKSNDLKTLYAFCRKSDDLVDDIELSNQEKQNNLNEWRTNLIKALAGESNDTLLFKVTDLIKKYKIDENYFFELLDGMEMDITKNKYSTFDELDEYCYKVASTVGLICLEIFGYKNPSTRDFAINLGKALQLTNIIRDIQIDLKIGRIYIPTEDINKYNKINQDLFDEKLIQLEIDRAKKYYTLAMNSLKRNEINNMLPALLIKDTYFALLKNLEKNKDKIIKGKIRLSKLSKISITIKSLIRYKIFKYL